MLGWMGEIQAEYQKRKSAWETEYAHAQTSGKSLLTACLVSLALLGVCIYQTVTNAEPLLWAAVPGTATCLLARWEYKWRKRARRALQLIVMYESALARLGGFDSGAAATGDEFAEPGHLYDRDLHVLGQHSLFAMLATTRTVLGQEKLAQMLLQPTDSGTVKDRQVAVRELLPQLELREQVEALGNSKFDQARPRDFAVWLQSSNGQLNSRVHIWLALITCAWLGALGLSFFGGAHSSLSGSCALLGIGVQAAICFTIREQVSDELERARRLEGQVSILRYGLRLLGSASFESSLLRYIRNEALNTRALDRLRVVLAALEQRNKEWFYVLFTLLGLGTHLAVYFRIWRFRHESDLKRWLAAWGTFDAVLAIATYAREHPTNVWPEISGDEIVFSAKGLAHPLLSAETAIANDVHLGGAQSLLVISGSNMAGKSTLLRSIGCNMILAFCGAPVRAQSLRTGVLKLGASIALVDSLADGRSKFLAEVERLRDLVHRSQAAHGHMLFLLDEIFSGTNSEDRRIATEAVMETLMSTGAVGALSTHDLALTKLVSDEVVRGFNMHMASIDPNDPLAFDYKLKPGVYQVTNGLAIVKMLGFAISQSNRG